MSTSLGLQSGISFNRSEAEVKTASSEELPARTPPQGGICFSNGALRLQAHQCVICAGEPAGATVFQIR